MNAKETLNELVKSNGFEAVLARSSVSRATLYRVLSGENTSVETLQKILSACGHSIQIVPDGRPEQ
jgi:predicted transcriptional regulator